ncbi:MAG TPA: tripartite tricarboxylate transporter substrate binding protein [Burkholderiales bacterium]|jgi:tripartite-type tricarboxylate transporter receptor subunit TctC|nr:tripartite tricarboxylate transporter substrate binding protein [Burkholderiales bacterium]
MGRILTVLLASLFAAGASAADPAASYPNRPVRLITGSPGSTSDIAARFVAQKLAERWGQQVVVDNRPGAGGIIGAEIAARAAPDGYTLMVGQIGTHASAQFLFKKLAYDPVKDFLPITLMTNSGIALAVNPSVPAKDLKSFVEYAKAKPGSVNYGSAGGGTSSQLSGELFNQMTGARLVHIPYKGAGPALTALIAGETQAAFLSTTTISAQAKAGKVRPLAVLSEKRFPAAPDIPSAGEAGFAGLDSSVWFGLFAPAKTPKPIVVKVNRDVVEILRSPDAKAALLKQGAEAVPTTPEEFGAFLKKEIAKWSKVIKEAGIKAN